MKLNDKVILCKIEKYERRIISLGVGSTYCVKRAIKMFQIIYYFITSLGNELCGALPRLALLSSLDLELLVFV